MQTGCTAVHPARRDPDIRLIRLASFRSGPGTHRTEADHTTMTCAQAWRSTAAQDGQRVGTALTGDVGQIDHLDVLNTARLGRRSGHWRMPG